MSKYIKLEDAISLFGRSGEYHADAIVDMLFFLPTIEVSEDCISREWVKGICEIMLDEEMLGHMIGYIKDAPSVVPKTQMKTQNSNKNSNVIYDGVSEAVRCAMCSNPNKSDRGCDGACSYDEKLYERIIKAIVESVAIIPKSKEGEWVEVDDSVQPICSKCGMACSGIHRNADYSVVPTWKYCPNCGARMKGADDE